MYERLARLYDSQGSADFAPLLLERVLPDLPRGGHLLDLACGTGTLCVALAAAGFRVTGLDRSDAMLEEARGKLEAAGAAAAVTLRRADMRDFTLDPPADAALSTFGAINNLLDPADLARCFTCVARALTPGGLFVFDLDSEANFRELWRGETEDHGPDWRLSVRASYDPATRLGTARYTARAFRGGRYRVDEDVVVQRWFPDDEVRAALAAAGFERVRVEPFNPFGRMPSGAAASAIWRARASSPQEPAPPPIAP